MSPLTQSRLAELTLCDSIWSGIGQVFRGSITDYVRSVWLGSGYLGDWALTNLCRNCRSKGGVEKCRHFEIDTARHLAGPFKAIQDPNVRMVMILKAAQTAGSLVWDMTLHYLLVHGPYKRIKVLMDCDKKAQKYCVERLMDTLRANPDIAPLLPTGAARFGVTDTAMRLLNGKTLFVGGLNESNVSSLPADVMVLDEGWLHQADGLMKKGVDRLKQTSNGKIIVVGQAGNVKEDQDDIWNGLDVRVPVTWLCPLCRHRQQFEFQKKRPEDFRPATDFAPLIPCLVPPMEPPNPGTFVGFKIGKKISELNSADDIKAACADTRIECYACGFEIQDTRQMRQWLNDSYDQEYQLTAPDGSKYTPPGFEVGFWNPDPASMFVPFGKTMVRYINAFKAKELGNIIELRDFYLSCWAQPWDPDAEQKNRNLDLVTGSYETDPTRLMSNFHSRNMSVDSQKKLDAGPQEDVVGSFWYVVREFDRLGNSLQRARGFARSWDEVLAVQKFWKVPNARLVIDCSKWGPQIEMVAAMNFELVTPSIPNPLNGRRDPFASGWRLFYGDKRAEFKIDGKPSAVSSGAETRMYKVERDGKTYVFRLFRYRWSNIAYEMQLDAILSKTPGMPHWESLPREGLRLPNGQLDEVTLAKEADILTFEQQMGARYKTKVRGVDKMEDIKGREAHYRDCELMLLVRASQDNLLGHVQNPIEVTAVGEAGNS